jgi:hypothetical protein
MPVHHPWLETRYLERKLSRSIYIDTLIKARVDRKTLFEHLVRISMATVLRDQIRTEKSKRQTEQQRAGKVRARRFVLRILRIASEIKSYKGLLMSPELAQLPELLELCASCLSIPTKPRRWDTLQNHYIIKLSDFVHAATRRRFHDEVAGACTQVMRLEGSDRVLSANDLKSLLSRYPELRSHRNPFRRTHNS